MAFDKLELCPVGALTAAWQNVVPREEFIADPIEAARISIHTWIDIAEEAGLDGLEVASALAIPDSYIDPETMLDPVAAHLPVRTPVEGEGQDLNPKYATEIINRCENKGVQIFSLGAFENLLHPDPKIRAQLHAHTLRCARAAVSLKDAGCKAVTGFVGADWTKSADENLALFEEVLIPLFLQIQDMEVEFRVENCPMPGWNNTGRFFYNEASTPHHWCLMFDIADDHGLDLFGLNYDPSHDILMGMRPETSFAVLDDNGDGHRVMSIHAKDQHINAGKKAKYGYHGKRSNLRSEWDRMIADHGMPGMCWHNPESMVKGLSVDFIGQQIGLRQILGDVSEVPFIIEHEWNPNRVQDRERVAEMLFISQQAVRAFDTLAAVECATSVFCDKHQIPVPGVLNPLLDYDEDSDLRADIYDA